MTVKAWLRGHDFELQDLADLLPSGDTRVVKDIHGYYMTSAEIEHRPAGVAVHEVALRVLRRVNGLGRAQNPRFEPVELAGHYTDEGRVHAVVVAETVKARSRVQAVAVVTGPEGEILPTIPARGPARERVAAERPEVQEALEIMGQPEVLSWIQLYKVFEIVRDDVKPQSFADLGWASASEVKAFSGSANRPDVSGAAARHARMGGSPPRQTMPLDVARDFIGRLVASWIDSKC